MNTRLSLWVSVAVVLAGALAVAVSTLNPFMTAGANNRLESKCPETGVTFTYDRSSWTPLLWSCAASEIDGTDSTTVRPFW